MSLKTTSGYIADRDKCKTNLSYITLLVQNHPYAMDDSSCDMILFPHLFVIDDHGFPFLPEM